MGVTRINRPQRRKASDGFRPINLERGLQLQAKEHSRDARNIIRTAILCSGPVNLRCVKRPLVIVRTVAKPIHAGGWASTFVAMPATRPKAATEIATHQRQTEGHAAW